MMTEGGVHLEGREVHLDKGEIRPEELDVNPEELAVPEKKDSPELTRLTLEDLNFYEIYRDRADKGQLSEAEQRMFNLLSTFRIEALTDELTRVSNRKAFNLEVEKLEQENARKIAESEGREFRERTENEEKDDYIFFIDVNDFKDVNTQFEHKGGDKALQHVAEQMESALNELLREDDKVFRVAGDEFCVIARGAGEEGAKIVAERLYQQLTETPVTLENKDGEAVEFHVQVGIGYAPIDRDKPISFAIANADSALMHIAKAKKKVGEPSIAYAGEAWSPPPNDGEPTPEAEGEAS